MLKHKLLTLFVALCATTTLWASNTITYTATGKLKNYTLDVGETTFGPAITSHTFSNRTGTIICSGEITKIGYRAFSGCTNLTSITIPNSVITIGDDAFVGCSSLPVVNNIRYADTYLVGVVDKTLSTYNIKEGTKWIGNEAFAYCYSLTSITIPNSVTEIGSSAFTNCRGLTSPVYNANSFAYMPTSYIGNYTIPDGIKQIAGSAFSNCTGLTSVTIPNSVTTIENGAFYHCSGLTSITIGNSVTMIGDDAFTNCTSLPVVDNIRYADTYLVEAVDKTLSNYVIKEGIKWIGSSAFEGCYSMTSITIPNSVTEIGRSAFQSCSSLTSVTIPNSVTTIGSSAFRDCRGLTSVTIPNSVTTIGGYAFSYSGLTSVIIGNSVTTIGYAAFLLCNSLTSVTIGNSVTTIESSAFDFCEHLNSVTIPNSVTSIGSSAFGGVLNVIYHGTATGAPWGALCHNGYFEDNLVYSDASKTTLWRCSRKVSGDIIIPNSVTAIKERAFADCIMKSVTIPYSVKTMGEEVFHKCDNLKTIYYYNYNITDKIKSCINSTVSLIFGGVHIEAIETTPSMVVLRNTANTDKNVISDWKVTWNDVTYSMDNAEGIILTGLKPYSKYDFVSYIQLAGEQEWKYDNTISITTPALELTTLTPKVVSEGTAIVAASTNISDYETNVGFEWRKDNAPEGSASKSGAAIICNGIMEGRLLNLGTDWWKVRPYYEAADGTRYYGDWAYIDPTDASYFEPTVHTYAMATSPTGNQVQVRGYVMTGTDEVTEQGFEYWFNSGQKVPNRMPAATPDSIYRVTASGQVMTAILKDLAYSTTYTCRAYAVADGKTYYGEEVQFLTPEDPRPIYTLTLDAGIGGHVNVEAAGQYREGEQVTLRATADKGYVFVQWSDLNTENPRTITMTSDITLSAIFEEGQQDVENVNENTPSNTTKFLRNGQVIIKKNDKTFTILGQEVR